MRSIPVRIADGLAEDIERLSLRAYIALGCRDLARVDVRLSGDGVPNVCAVDALPPLTGDEALGALLPAAEAVGVGLEELILRCLVLAAERSGVALPNVPVFSRLPRRTPPGGMRIRPT